MAMKGPVPTGDFGFAGPLSKPPEFVMDPSFRLAVVVAAKAVLEHVEQMSPWLVVCSARSQSHRTPITLSPKQYHMMLFVLISRCKIDDVCQTQ